MPEFADLFPGATRNVANYRGDIAAHILADTHPFGPDLHGAYYAPVSAVYEPATDQTKVTFRPIPRRQSTNRKRDQQPSPFGLNRRQRRLLGDTKHGKQSHRNA
ncbi:hypothetical protein [Mycobacteroides abscessus]|uniref:hypothetical protein n=1 Tax=Mycobacteroides abscessus TaxID=36809 RepID=UPI0002584732|nr:hypothetical protein [Mycobacteroides abscessus]EIC64360.1 hypothetical protein OUW_16457 [Mycobacteroides abscessus M93]MDO3068498.1 hypothetical protein [Mycobacteroides abscessus subsp. bolletii]